MKVLFDTSVVVTAFIISGGASYDGLIMRAADKSKA
ncbi:unnamed protein product, partial [marine sediment metagenome]